MLNKRLFSYFSKSVKASIFKTPFSLFGSSIKLATRDGIVESSQTHQFNIDLNWQLAKVWVNPLNNVHHNILQSSFSGMMSNEAPVTAVNSKIEFERFLRKMGLVISREDNVYVQDGIYNDKKMSVSELNTEFARIKEEGNTEFKAKSFMMAASKFTEGINIYLKNKDSCESDTELNTKVI